MRGGDWANYAGIACFATRRSFDPNYAEYRVGMGDVLER